MERSCAENGSYFQNNISVHRVRGVDEEYGGRECKEFGTGSMDEVRIIIRIVSENSY